MTRIWPGISVVVALFFVGCGLTEGVLYDERCARLQCPDKSTCEVEAEEAVCVCDVGFVQGEGGACEGRDPCAELQCPDGSGCVTEDGAAVCECGDGLVLFEGECVGLCANVECGFGGSCEVLGGAAVCDCPEGFLNEDAACVQDISAGICPKLGDSVQPSIGQTFFVCDCEEGADGRCEPGDDGASGLSPLTPWRTYTRARVAFSELEAGGAIVFCRGGAFGGDAQGTWGNARCSAELPCLVRDYQPPWGDAELGRPVLHAFDAPALDFGTQGPMEGLIVSELELAGPGGAVNAVVLGNGSADITLCDNLIRDFDEGILILSDASQISGGSPTNARIKIVGGSLSGNRSHAFFGNAEDLEIRNVLIETDLAAPLLKVFSDSGAVFSGLRIESNRLRTATPDLETCGHGMVDVVGRNENVKIRFNELFDLSADAGGSCRGIQVGTHFESVLQEASGLLVQGNKLSRATEVPIGINACSSCVVENNIIVAEAGVNGGVQAPFETLEQGETMLRNTIRNNTIVIDVAEGSSVGIKVGPEGSDFVLASNAIVYLGESLFGCIGVEASDDALESVDHNLCFSPNTPNGFWALVEAGDAVVKEGLDEFQLRGFAGNSVAADPIFTDLEERIFTAADGDSPMVDAGDPERSSLKDIERRQRGEAPDIGAFER